jgi:hypothetical protein
MSEPVKVWTIDENGNVYHKGRLIFGLIYAEKPDDKYMAKKDAMKLGEKIVAVLNKNTKN